MRIICLVMLVESFLKRSLELDCSCIFQRAIPKHALTEQFAVTIWLLT